MRVLDVLGIFLVLWIAWSLHRLVRWVKANLEPVAPVAEGTDIWIHSFGQTRRCVVVGVAEDGSLLVRPATPDL